MCYRCVLLRDYRSRNITRRVDSEFGIRNGETRSLTLFRDLRF
jgi:hypothetical protein